MISQTLVIKGQCKSGKNAMQTTRHGAHYPKPQFKLWRAEVVRQIAAQVGNLEPINQPVKATIRYTPGDLIRRDATGIMDALWHCFEFAKIITDDALIQAVDYAQEPLDRANPRVSIVFAYRNPCDPTTPTL